MSIDIPALDVTTITCGCSIAIVGRSCTGKTSYARQLVKYDTYVVVFSTDKYMFPFGNKFIRNDMEFEEFIHDVHHSPNNSRTYVNYRYV